MKIKEIKNSRGVWEIIYHDKKTTIDGIEYPTYLVDGEKHIQTECEECTTYIDIPVEEFIQNEIDENKSNRSICEKCYEML